MIDKISYLKKLKYEDLNNLLISQFINQKYNQINLYFDVRNIFRKLFTEQYVNYYDNVIGTDFIYNKGVFINELLNTIGHYKKYFEKKGMFTQVFLYYNDKPSAFHTAFNPTYKKYYYDKYLDKNGLYSGLIDYFDKSLEICKSITAYFENIHMFNVGDMDTDAIPYHLMNNLNNEMNKYHMIFGYSLKNLTYLNYYSNVWLFHPTQENVYFATKDQGQVEYLNKELNNASLKKFHNFNELRNYTIPMLAMTGIEKYGINRVGNYTPFKVINSVINKPEHYAPKNYREVKQMFNIADEHDKQMRFNIAQLSLSTEVATYKIDSIKSQITFADSRKAIDIINREHFNNKLIIDNLI